MKRFLIGAALAMVTCAPRLVLAQETAAPAVAPEPDYPRVGGHFGLALPLVTIGKQTAAIGADYTLLGLAPGVTVKLSERWAIDFEMVAYSNFHDSTAVSSLVVDPGVIYNFGFAAAGLRTAVHVGKVTNWGFIPIILKAFKLGDGPVSIFVELDLPIFINDDGVALTIQPQAGVGF